MVVQVPGSTNGFPRFAVEREGRVVVAVLVVDAAEHELRHRTGRRRRPAGPFLGSWALSCRACSCRSAGRRFAQDGTAAAALRQLVYHVPADRRLHARAGGIIWTRASTRSCGGWRACCARASRVPDGWTAKPSARGPARRRSARMTPGRPSVLHGAPVSRATPQRGERRRTVRVTAAVSSPRPFPPVVQPSTSAFARPRPGVAPRSSCACASRPS